MLPKDVGSDTPSVRIGELSRRVGVSEYVLRAWEARYGLLKPARSSGGYRLYSDADEIRIRHMKAHLAGGLAAAQAARAALAEESTPATTTAGTTDTTPDTNPDAATDPKPPSSAELAGFVAELRDALDGWDEPAAQASLDRLLAEFTVETALRQVVLPYLHELGERWAAGAITIAHEHFASHVVRGRLTNLARGWGNGVGPRALLACPPGEEHDLALLAFGIALNRRGWRIAYLGSNTPTADVIATAESVRPDLVVMAATAPTRLTAIAAELTALARVAPLTLAGSGATRALAEEVGAAYLSEDPITAAATLRAR